jgi:serine protease Do
MPFYNKRLRVLMIILALVLVSACSVPKPVATPEAAKDTPTEAATPQPVDEPAKPTKPAEPVASGAVSALEDVKSASVQIEAQGSFVDPEVGLQMNTAGRGSGFIIDPSGIVVTNNHVATGAAFLKVWVGGESRPRNAKVLGVSECSDLAVIDIDGEGFSFLEWHSGDIKPGLEIYAAGFPLGDPEYTLTRGIVSKERADGESDWASVDYVIEHDARINPGNSGGPLVTRDGKLVGVNYAGNNAGQSFAIGRDEAQRVIEQLRQGTDVTSIGVNGQAVSDGQGLTGIWVASVKSGSPADRAGIKGGDIITHMEGLALATDGTMSDYCDILRSRNASDVMSVTILRYASEEVLEGQLNGRVLEQSFSFARQFEENVQQSGGGGGGSTSYSRYTGVTDDTNAIYMEVPAEWRQVRGEVFRGDDGSVLGASIVAAPDLDEFDQWYDVPGVLFIASRQLAANFNEESLLDLLSIDNACSSYEGRYDYEDALYVGKYDLYTGCGTDNGAVIQVAAVPSSRAFIMLVSIQAVTEADLEAADRIFDTFQVTGTLP